MVGAEGFEPSTFCSRRGFYAIGATLRKCVTLDFTAFRFIVNDPFFEK